MNHSGSIYHYQIFRTQGLSAFILLNHDMEMNISFNKTLNCYLKK